MPRKNAPLHTLTVLGALTLGACGQVTTTPPDDQPDQQTFTFDFQQDAEGFTGGFAEYSQGQSIDGVAERRTLPEPLNTGEGALFLGGTNVSDDLFMFFKKNLTGLEPNTTYRVNFEVKFATNVPQNCAGIGGSPGESVWVKAGVTDEEPVVVLEEGDYEITSLDKGRQSLGGDDAVVLGNFANSQECSEAGSTTDYELKTVSNPDNSVTVTTDADGEVWLVVGTDSGFEGRTEIYIDQVEATFTEINN